MGEIKLLSNLVKENNEIVGAVNVASNTARDKGRTSNDLLIHVHMHKVVTGIWVWGGKTSSV